MKKEPVHMGERRLFTQWDMSQVSKLIKLVTEILLTWQGVNKYLEESTVIISFGF